jgi:hypothetical protein
LTGSAIATVTLTAANATTYAVKSGSSLPAGLSLSSAGALTGTPSTAGSYSFAVTATGTSSIAVADRTFTLLVSSTPSWNTGATLSAALTGSAIATVALSAANATSYAVKSGSSLPAGLSLSSAGALTGTPSTAGSYSFAVTATGTSSIAVADRTFTLLVATTPSWSTAAGLSDVLTGSAISAVNLSATNATTYAVKSGSSLPAGLSLSSAGALTGTPSTAGSYSFAVTATGTASIAVADRTFTLLVATTPSWTTAAGLAGLTAGTAMTTAVALTATNAVSYAVKAGSSLPAGLSLSSAGSLTGTPSSAGSYTFTVTATGASSIATAERTFTVSVSAAASAVTSSGTYTLNLAGMPAPSSFYVDNVMDGGSWMLVYETTSATRNASGFIPYTVDKKSALGSAAVTRLAYRLQNNGVYAWASFPAWSGSYDVPTGGSASNVFTNRRDVAGMTVISNAPNVTNTSSTNGTLEIWPSNYGTGSGGVYDGNDDGFNTSIGHGSFQVHNSSLSQCVFAWNNHGSVPAIGFGNQPSGQPDWTFADNGAAGDFKLQIFAYAGPLGGTIPARALDLDASTISVGQGGAVSSWSNSGTLGASYSATGVNGPTLGSSGGRNHVAFNRGGSQYMYVTNSFAFDWFNKGGVYNGLTVFFVAHFTSAGTWERLMDFGNGPANQNILMTRFGSSTQMRASFVEAGGERTTEANMPTDGFHIYCMNIGNNGSASSIALYINNAVAPVSSATGLPPISNRTLSNNFIGRSNWGGDQLFHGHMRHIMFFSSSLGASDMTNVFAHLKRKWGMDTYPNAAAIRAANSSAPDGDYLIQPPGQAAILCYVNFSNAPAGKGWVLVQRGRESTDYWQAAGQNTASGLGVAQLGTNTPVANAPSAWVNSLTGGWSSTRLLLNRPLTGDSFVYKGTTAAAFAWSSFTSEVSQVSADIARYPAMWGSGGALTAGTVANTNRWADSLYLGANSTGNDQTRSFSWTWGDHGGYQGWSHGQNSSPSGSYVHANESHGITRANVYVEC